MMEATLNDPQWSRMFMVRWAGRGAEKALTFKSGSGKAASSSPFYFFRVGPCSPQSWPHSGCRVPALPSVFACSELLILYLS